jgi:hypothetical protein
VITGYRILLLTESLAIPVNLRLQDPSPLESARGEGKDKKKAWESASHTGSTDVRQRFY